MAAGGAADAQARFGHSVKGLLTEKVTSCGTDVIALTKQVLKGSRSAELLGQAARNMVMQEDAILHSEDARSNSEEVSSQMKQHQENLGDVWGLMQREKQWSRVGENRVKKFLAAGRSCPVGECFRSVKSWRFERREDFYQNFHLFH
ncbi:BLOC-1-related complex subunit 7 isoform X1 [Dryobates pubescens]|uniref:BLOC-1-related complex subunit 7 isoform X1 n=1 Tax=Dryobates pubescens TaxID=118200 RepID=UPI0023BA101B|nr:BLOC-1-related complex subunit 7 isoform X1 [Dryobates pubescens]